MFSAVSQSIAATPPLLSVKVAYRNPKTGLTRGGYRRRSLPLKPIALKGASHEIVSPTALEWHTKSQVLRSRRWTMGDRFLLRCQRWQSRVADFFCYFWSVCSKRTLLTKSVVWKGAQQTLSIPPAAAERLQMHFKTRASTMPRRQPRVSQNPCSEDSSKSNPSQSKKPGVYMEV